MNTIEQNEAQGEGESNEGQTPEEAEPCKVVSLAYELSVLEEAVGGSRILADAIRSEILDDEDETRRAISGLTSILSLVACRLRDVGRVASGFVDPSSIFATHNEALPDLAGEGEQAEVRLRAWSPRKRLRRLKEEASEVRAQLGALKKGRQREGP